MAQPKKKSLQDVLRERRAAAPLLSARELREREAARRREEVEREAAGLVARWRAERTAVDADGKLGPAVYAAVFAVEPACVSGEQALVAPLVGAAEGDACLRGRTVREVRGTAGAPPQSRRARGGSRRPGLSTLCEGCLRRAVKLEQEPAAPGTRAELQALDPERLLFNPAAIAALKERNSRARTSPSIEG